MVQVSRTFWNVVLSPKDRLLFEEQMRLLVQNYPLFLILNFFGYAVCTLLFYNRLSTSTHILLGVSLILISLFTRQQVKKVAKYPSMPVPTGLIPLTLCGALLVIWWNVYTMALYLVHDEGLIRDYMLVISMTSLLGVALVGRFSRIYSFWLVVSAFHIVTVFLTWGTVSSRILSVQYLIAVLAQLFFLRVLNDKISRLLQIKLENNDLVEALQQKNNALQQANLSQSRYLSAASHDLRQPLHALALLTNDAQRKNKSPEVDDTLKKIESAIDSLSQSFNSMLNLSRLDAGVVKPQFTRFPIARLFTRLQVEYEEVAAKKGLRLQIKWTDAWVLSDEGMLYSILSNFVSNALRYTDTGGVLIGVRRMGGDNLKLMVYDTGSGVPTEKARQIFQEYLRLENAEQRAQGGVGLGLAISERMARLLGARLLVQSAINQGSCFGLIVPKVEAQEAVIPEWTAPVVSAGNRLAGLRVAIVDDDDTALTGLDELLTSWDMDVSVVLSREMLEETIAEEGGFDLMITDYHLSQPDETGLDIIRAAKSFECMADGHFLLLTGDTSTELANQAQKEGAVIWYKPLRPARLRAYLNTLFEGRDTAA